MKAPSFSVELFNESNYHLYISIMGNSFFDGFTRAHAFRNLARQSFRDGVDFKMNIVGFDETDLERICISKEGAIVDEPAPKRVFEVFAPSFSSLTEATRELDIDLKVAIKGNEPNFSDANAKIIIENSHVNGGIFYCQMFTCAHNSVGLMTASVTIFSKSKAYLGPILFDPNTAIQIGINPRMSAELFL